MKRVKPENRYVGRYAVKNPDIPGRRVFTAPAREWPRRVLSASRSLSQALMGIATADNEERQAIRYELKHLITPEATDILYECGVFVDGRANMALEHLYGKVRAAHRVIFVGSKAKVGQGQYREVPSAIAHGLCLADFRREVGANVRAHLQSRQHYREQVQSGAVQPGSPTYARRHIALTNVVEGPLSWVCDILETAQ